MEKGNPGYFGPARRTVLHAGPRLLTRIKDYDIGLEDLGRNKNQEVILLKREKADYWDDGGLIEYDDTPTIRHYRAEMQVINAWLADAEVAFDSIAVDDDTLVVDETDRYLRRYFTNGSFDSGGRLFGGFWQHLPKWLRRKGILIEGEDVTTLDYAQMAPRILYGVAKAPVPVQDAYLLPGLEGYRKGVKKLMNALLFAENRLTRFPKDTRQLFPAGITVEEVITKLEQSHAPIRHLFFTGIGHKVQFVESEILVDVLLALKQQEVVGLPIHDAVVVPGSAASLATTIMEDTFQAHTGIGGRVMEEEG